MKTCRTSETREYPGSSFSWIPLRAGFGLRLRQDASSSSDRNKRITWPGEHSANRWPRITGVWHRNRPRVRQNVHARTHTHAQSPHYTAALGSQRASAKLHFTVFTWTLQPPQWLSQGQDGILVMWQLFSILPIKVVASKTFNISPISGRAVSSQQSVQNTSADKRGLKWPDLPIGQRSDCLMSRAQITFQVFLKCTRHEWNDIACAQKANKRKSV